MIKDEFLKPNKAKIKTFIAILLVAGICFLILGNAMGKSLSGLLWGPSPKTEIYETIAGLLSLVLFFPTLVLWFLLSFFKMHIAGIILGFILNLVAWYYLACGIYSFKERKKKTPAP